MTRSTSPPTRTGTRRGASSIGVTSRPRQRSWRRVRSSSATDAPSRCFNDVRIDTPLRLATPTTAGPVHDGCAQAGAEQHETAGEHEERTDRDARRRQAAAATATATATATSTRAPSRRSWRRRCDRGGRRGGRGRGGAAGRDRARGRGRVDSAVVQWSSWSSTSCPAGVAPERLGERRVAGVEGVERLRAGDNRVAQGGPDPRWWCSTSGCR